LCCNSHLIVFCCDQSKKPRQKHKEVVRSNEGCHKTRVNCPRCHMEWGRAELGLETAAYNLLMMGLKEYVCGRCACSFGCMTAEHKCPHCRKPFDYSPQDYHRKIVCGNAGCGKKFVSAATLGLGCDCCRP